MSYRDELVAAMQSAAVAKPTAVDVAGWGVVYFRDATVAEVDEQSDDALDAEKKDKRTLTRTLARLLCDQSGARMFDENSADDMALLGSQPYPNLRKIIDVINASVKASAEGN